MNEDATNVAEQFKLGKKLTWMVHGTRISITVKEFLR
jgi:hypothetical protein